MVEKQQYCYSDRRLLVLVSPWYFNFLIVLTFIFYTWHLRLTSLHMLHAGNRAMWREERSRKEPTDGKTTKESCSSLMRRTPSINLSSLPDTTPSLQSGHPGHSPPQEIFLCVFFQESPAEVVERMVIARMIYLGEQVQKSSVFMTI
jgi:hypothetical protein